LTRRIYMYKYISDTVLLSTLFMFEINQS